MRCKRVSIPGKQIGDRLEDHFGGHRLRPLHGSCHKKFRENGWLGDWPALQAAFLDLVMKEGGGKNGIANLFAHQFKDRIGASNLDFYFQFCAGLVRGILNQTS